MATAIRSVRGGVTAFASLTALVTGLALIDGRVRSQVAQMLETRGPTDEIVTIGYRFEDLAYIVMQAVRDQSIEHAPMVIFALAAMVLLLFMTRT